MSSNSYVTILAGNPGSGKSTILNTLAGGVMFEAGVNIGQGKTKVVDVKTGNDGSLYGDTPGLDDVEIRAQAAREISNMLRDNNSIKLCFVVTLEAGRVKPSDVATMCIILDALTTITANNFSIIINKVSKAVVEQLNGEAWRRLVLSLTPKLHTSYIFTVNLDAGAFDTDNTLLSGVQELKSIFDTMPIFGYDPKDVEDVKHDAFEVMRNEFQNQIIAITNANKAQIDAMVLRHEEVLQEQTAAAERRLQNYENRVTEITAEHARNIQNLQNSIDAAKRSRGGFFGRLGEIIDGLLP